MIQEGTWSSLMMLNLQSGTNVLEQQYGAFLSDISCSTSQYWTKSYWHYSDIETGAPGLGNFSLGESIADKRDISTDNNILTRLLFTADGWTACPIEDKLGLWLNFKYTVGQTTFTPECDIKVTVW